MRHDGTDSARDARLKPRVIECLEIHELLWESAEGKRSQRIDALLGHQRSPGTLWQPCLVAAGSGPRTAALGLLVAAPYTSLASGRLIPARLRVSSELRSNGIIEAWQYQRNVRIFVSFTHLSINGEPILLKPLSHLSRVII